MFKDLKKRFPHIHLCLERDGSIAVRNREELKRYDSEYAQFKDLMPQAYMPVIHVSDATGFVWEEQAHHESLMDAIVELEEFLKNWITTGPLRKTFVVSVESILRTGEFGPVKLNMHRRDVEAVLGLPSSYVRPRVLGYRKAAIWYYGDMQFQFEFGSDRLCAILNTGRHSYGSMESIVFEPTEISVIHLADFEKEGLNDRQIETKLAEYNVKFERQKLDDDVIKFVCESGAEIVCEYDNDEGVYYPDCLCIKSSDYVIPEREKYSFVLYSDDRKVG